MNVRFPYATHMLNLGKHEYMFRICSMLQVLAEIAEDTSGINYTDLIEELEYDIRAVEREAQDRYTDWATD